jgi:hypothetical protein
MPVDGKVVSVARGEQEGDAESGQRIRDRRHLLATQVDVEHGGAQAAINGRPRHEPQGLAESKGDQDLRARHAQFVFEQHGDEGLVLDDQHAAVPEPGLRGRRRRDGMTAHGRRSGGV